MNDLKSIDLTEGRKLSKHSDINLHTTVNNIESRLRARLIGKDTSNLTAYTITSNNIPQSWIVSNISVDDEFVNNYTITSWYEDDLTSINNNFSTTITSVNNLTSTKYTINPKIKWYSMDKKSDDILSRLRGSEWISTRSDSILSRIRSKTNYDDIKYGIDNDSIIRRLSSLSMVMYNYDYDDTIDRLRSLDEDSSDFGSFSRRERKIFKLIPFIRRLYSTNLNRSFDEIEFNLDMAIAKERLEEAIKNTNFILPTQIQMDNSNKIITSEEQTWITTQTSLVSI